jgi:hypothetical protein
MAGDKTCERQALDRNRDLADKYRKIGITAVAAAVRFQGARSDSLRRSEETDRASSRRGPSSGAKPRGE